MIVLTTNTMDGGKMNINLQGAKIVNSCIGCVGSTVINGRRVDAHNSNRSIKRKTFNEFKGCEGSEVDAVRISSTSFDVNVHQSETSKIIVKLCGEALVEDGDVSFEIFIDTRVLFINLEVEGILVSSDIKFDVYLPSKMFKKLFVEAEVSDIFISSGVFVQKLETHVASGNIKTSATVRRAKLKANNGLIEVAFKADSDVEIKASTMNGNINIKLENIRRIKLDADTMNGRVKNYHTATRGHTARINAQTMNGNIIVS